MSRCADSVPKRGSSGILTDHHLRMITVGLDVGALHLMVMSTSAPRRLTIGHGAIDPVIGLTSATARAGIQILAWEQLVGTHHSRVRIINPDDFSAATNVDHDLSRSFAEAAKTWDDMAADRGGNLAASRLDWQFWNLYRTRVQGRAPRDFEFGEALEVSSLLMTQDRLSSRYFVALINGPPTDEQREHLDFLDQYNLFCRAGESVR